MGIAEQEIAPIPAVPRKTLRCQDCKTALAELVSRDRRLVLRWLIPNSETDDAMGETRITCPTCGRVRVVTHR